MNELKVQEGSQLPAVPEELSKFIAVGDAAVLAARQLIRSKAIDTDEYRSLVQRGQEQAEVVLEAKIRLGAMLAELPKGAGNQYTKKVLCSSPEQSTPAAEDPPGGLPEGEAAGNEQHTTRQEVYDSLGLSRKEAALYQKMAENPDAVEKAKAIARENNDLVTASLVEAVIRRENKTEGTPDAIPPEAGPPPETPAEPEPPPYTPPKVCCLSAADLFPHCHPYDLLLTYPLYESNEEDFVNSWLYEGLARLKNSGSAYIFIDPIPGNIPAYLRAKLPEHIHLQEILVWTFKNTGMWEPYRQNFKLCLYYRGDCAPVPAISDDERDAVMAFDADGGAPPQELAEMLIRHSTKPGDRVCDPFVRQGTTVLAAAKLNRIGIGADKSESNIRIAGERGCILV